MGRPPIRRHPREQHVALASVLLLAVLARVAAQPPPPAAPIFYQQASCCDSHPTAAVRLEWREMLVNFFTTPQPVGADVCSGSGYATRCCDPILGIGGPLGSCTYALDEGTPDAAACYVCNTCAGYGCRFFDSDAPPPGAPQPALPPPLPPLPCLLYTSPSPRDS